MGVPKDAVSPAFSGAIAHTSFINVIVILGASLASFLFGFCNNAIAGTLARPSFNKKFLSGADAEAVVAGMIASFLVGGFIGTIIQWPISSRWGRRTCTSAAAVLVLVSSALIAGSESVPMYITFRITCGIGGGMVVANTPVYMSEIAPPQSRGILGSAQGIAVTLSYVVSSATALGFNYLNKPYDWRLQYVVEGAFALLLIIVVMFIPESPRWLIEHGRKDEAFAVLRRLHSTKHDPSAQLARAEFVQIEAQINAERELPSSFWYIFKNPSTRKRAFSTILVWVNGQSTGVTTIANIAPLLFKALGFDVELQLSLALAWVSACSIGTLLAPLFIERLGRVKSLVFGTWACLAVLLTQVLLQREYVGTTNTTGLNAATAMYFVFIFVFGLFMEDAGYIYVVEIWPTHLRSQGAVLGLAPLFLMTLIYSSPSTVALANIGWRYFLVFIVVGSVTSIVMLFTLPETAGLTLEEIGAKFGDDIVVNIHDIDLDEKEKVHEEVAHQETVIPTKIG